MTVADWTILAAIILAYAPIIVAKNTAGRSYNNATPRDPAVYAKGRLSRLWGAHVNGLENFPFFAAAVLLAELRMSPQHMVDVLAVIFIILRVAHLWAYISNRPALRTPLWMSGFVVNILIFILPAVATTVGLYIVL